MNTRTRGEEILPLDLEIEHTLRQKKKAKDKVLTDTTTTTSLSTSSTTMAENLPPPPPPERRPLNARFQPRLDDYQEGGWGRIEANNFEAVDTDAYDELMVKYARAQKELEFYKKKSLQVNSVYDELNEPIEEDIDYVQQRNYRQGGFRGNQAYVPNYRNHPNFSYANPNNGLQPPPGFNVKNGVIQEPVVKTPLEEMMERLEAQQKEFLYKTDKKIGALEHGVTSIGNSVIALTKQLNIVENQVGQMANAQAGVHKPGQFPSNTEPNPKNQQCHAIELRSGTRYVNHGLENEGVGDRGEEEAEPEGEIEKITPQASRPSLSAESPTRKAELPSPSSLSAMPIGREADREELLQKTRRGYRPGLSADNPDREVPSAYNNPPLGQPIGRETPGSAQMREYVHKAPFPQRLVKSKYDEKGCMEKTVGESQSLKNDYLAWGETHDRGRPLIHLPP